MASAAAQPCHEINARVRALGLPKYLKCCTYALIFWSSGNDARFDGILQHAPSKTIISITASRACRKTVNPDIAKVDHTLQAG